MKKVNMKELPLSARPYEKCREKGAESLSDAELLAVIIRTGSRDENSIMLAQRILALGDENKGILNIMHLAFPELMKIKGIGCVKATQLLCIGELSKRIWKKNATDRFLAFNSPLSIADFYMEQMRHLEQENLRAMFLNSKNVLIKDMLLSIGTVNSAQLTPRELFLEALKYQAVNIVLVHNHPSGDAAPSRADMEFTKRVKESGNLLGIRLIDHIIIGDNEYISFKERGIF